MILENVNDLFEVRHLSKTYSGIKVLDDVGFCVRRGEVHALVGENGAGKSTLIKLVAGIESADPGSEIYFNSKRETRLSAARTMEMGLAVIYQDISLFPNLSVAENICMTNSKAVFVNWAAIRERAARKFDQMGIEIDVSVKLGSLPIGKQQVVAIARALCFNANVIIMDEPTAALSSADIDILMGLIRRIKSEGMSVVYISHKLEEIFDIADRVSVLRDGKIVASDTIDAFDQHRLIHAMVGRELRFVPMHNEQGVTGENILELKNLTRKPCFRNISLSVKKYEILGITGLVGAGRSELAQTIFGMYKASGGEMLLNGKRFKPKSPKQATQLGIAYLPEDRCSQSMYFGHSAIKNLTIASLSKMLGKFNLLNSRKEGKATQEYIGKLQIRPNRPAINIESFSGGNQQKVMLARWLNTGPKLLIVDEPTMGVDVGSKQEIHKILRSLAKSGVGVILISSDLPEVLAISDRIVVMRRGDFITEITAEEATQETIIQRGLLG